MTTAIRQCLRSLSSGGGCQNAGLALERYLGQQDNVDSQRDLLENAVKIGVPDPYRRAYRRWTDALGKMGAKSAEFQVIDRLIVGLGGESVLETAITLNRVYGVPMVPGSALKGLARHYCQTEAGGLDTEAFKILFGDTTSAGYIIFFDAWYVPDSAPDDKPLKKDVITVHHSQYYTSAGKHAPTDFDDPNPVSFVSAVGRYLVALAGPDQKWTDFAFELLSRALAEWGVGGKTSSGYGRMAPGGEPDRAAAPSSRLAREVMQISPGKINEEIGRYGNEWVTMPDGDDKQQLAEALYSRLQEAGLLEKAKWTKKEWVAQLLAYISRQ